jgi:predicted ATP-grasp superfamily ATP-dependent carboligase
MPPLPPTLDRLEPAVLPAVLIGGINLVRALGLAGIPAIVASTNPEEPAFDSKYCAAGVVIPRLEPPEAAVEALLSLGDELAGEYGRRVPLFYGGDNALELVNGARERLERYYLLLLNDPEVCTALIAKDRFQAFARDRGLPVPRDYSWDGDGPGSLRGAGGPVLVKPSEKIDWHHSALCEQLFGGDGKARVFASGAEALADPMVASFHRQLVFQEYVPGGHEDQWSYHGFADADGRVLASFTGRKLRTFPAVTGESSFIELATEESLDAVGREIVARCPLRGFFKMDFKRDARTGRWCLLEINARCSLWHYLGAANGVNLMRVAFDYLTEGRNPAPARHGTRVRWLLLGIDYRAYKEMSARGETSFARWLASIVFSRKVYGLFAWTDPAPFLRSWRRRLAQLLGRGTGRMTARMRQWLSTAS